MTGDDVRAALAVSPDAYRLLATYLSEGDEAAAGHCLSQQVHAHLAVRAMTRPISDEGRAMLRAAGLLP